MTNASELFHSRRSRWGRSNHHFTFDTLPPGIASTFRHRNSSHHRRDSNAADNLRRPSHHARHLVPWVSYPEQTMAPTNQSENEFSSSTTTNADLSGRVGSIENDRLPGSVLLARARLLERLRGVNLFENRHNGNEVRLIEPSARDSETIIDQTLVASPFDLQVLQEQSTRLPGLTREALAGLHREVFSRAEDGASRDCSICLENFENGDNLIHLSCEHRFHGVCLDPWLQTCRDCPNCRRGIIID